MSDWQYTHVPGTEVILAVGGHTYFRYRCATDRDRPYGHPVTLALAADGTADLTCHAPHDHVWHAGFWFNWKYIDGVNYWENAADGHPEGRTRLDGPERLTAAADTVTLDARYAYIDPRRGAVAAEDRRLTWHRPDGDGSHRTDVTVAFHAPAAAVAPVVLDRTPINAETPWGGYAGLSWRFCRALGAVDGLDAEGRRHKAIEHRRAAWATLGGRLDGGPDLRAGVAMFDHPTNPGHPTHWRYIADPGFAYLNPSPLLADPITVAPGKTLTLRYRVLVYPGAPDGDRLAREHASFAKE